MTGLNSGSASEGYHVPLADVVLALNTELSVSQIPDYSGAVNGLQFENSGSVSRVAVAVDASSAAIDEAAAIGANLLIVHHGLFWSGVQPIAGIVRSKYQTLLQHDIAVYSSHLPLDAHPTLGNNIRLAEELGLLASGGFAKFKTIDIGVQGSCDLSTHELVERVSKFVEQYGGSVRTSIRANERFTKRWGICTGGGASSETIAEALASGIDTLIVGEGPHHTTVGAIEHGLCIIYAGHYATETLGVQSLGEFLKSKFQLPWSFLMLPTGS